MPVCPRSKVGQQWTDDVLAATLRTALQQHSVSGFTADDLAQLVLAWRRMEPWPDVAIGLPRLRSRFVV